MLGFGLFGPHDWAPAAARGLVIFGLIVFIGHLYLLIETFIEATIGHLYLFEPARNYLPERRLRPCDRYSKLN
ncbi:MAG: hypothetical protein Q6J74_09090, partial [Gloeomargarita sp. DG02_1_bins_92]